MISKFIRIHIKNMFIIKLNFMTNNSHIDPEIAKTNSNNKLKEYCSAKF